PRLRRNHRRRLAAWTHRLPGASASAAGNRIRHRRRARMTDTSPRRPVILAVDDEPAVLAAVRADLRGRYGRDYRVVTAAGGAEAIAALEQLKVRGDAVAIVISDQRMPDVGGTDVLHAAVKLFDGIRTVLLTAYADTEVAIGAINDLHLDYYILKPWDPPEE